MAAVEPGADRPADVACVEESRTDRARSEFSHSAYDMRQTKRVWTAVVM
jgi:hypothetical protein